MSCPECNLDVVPIYHGIVDMSIIYKVISLDMHIGQRYSIENYFCKNCKIALRDEEVVQ